MPRAAPASASSRKSRSASPKSPKARVPKTPSPPASDKSKASAKPKAAAKSKPRNTSTRKPKKSELPVVEEDEDDVKSPAAAADGDDDDDDVSVSIGDLLSEEELAVVIKYERLLNASTTMCRLLYVMYLVFGVALLAFPAQLRQWMSVLAGGASDDGLRYLGSYWVTLGLVFVAVARVDDLDVQRTALRYHMVGNCLIYTSPSPRDVEESRMPSRA